MISSAPTDAAPQSVIEHATTTERSRHMLPYARPGRAATRQLGDLRTLPSAIWLADFTVMFDMEVIVRRQNQEHCASITCMIRHYVARRAKVIEDHPHNAESSAHACPHSDTRLRIPMHEGGIGAITINGEAIAIGVGRDARLSTANYAKSAGDESAAAKR
jgi:hypothetical protein